MKRLQRVGLEAATAKGVTAEARWYPRQGARPSADVDLFLRPSDIAHADKALEVLEPGHQLQSVIVPLAEYGHLQSVDVVDGAGIQIDLHFDILKYEVDTRQRQVIWDRTQYFETPSDGQVRVMDAETSLILFLLHMNKDRFSHLLGFVDVVRLIDQEELDWSFIDDFVHNEGLDSHVYSALDTVFATLDLPAPAHPKPSGWRAAAWRRLWPDSVRLGGNSGRLSHPHRQYWIAFTARGRTGEAARRLMRRVFPSRELIDYYFPGRSGHYFLRLVLGRIETARRRRRLLTSGGVGQRETRCKEVRRDGKER